MRGCLCSILNAREEKLLDGEGRLILRLICNACGHVLDSELLPPKPLNEPRETLQDGAVIEASS
jgi:hypothetical protein